ncbi:MAG: selenide, water dikinase SelD [Alphaproteobacteria bacterium]|nr:selenide, water dikinase SelD [Alphaproteobacteria bacterium]
MHSDPLPQVRDLVFLGGGHTHALVLRKWGMKPVRGVRVTLINPDVTAPYTGMLPGYIAGHYDRDSLDIDLVRLARFAGARLIVGTATGIDREAKTVTVPGRPPIPYDVLSVDIGITSDLPSLPGFRQHGVAAKPLAGFARGWESFVARIKAENRRPNVTVIGGGVAGAELALAMAHRLNTQGTSGQITIVESLTPLEDLGQMARERLLQALADYRIEVREGVTAEEISAEGVTLTNGGFLAADLVVGAAGARPHDWLADTGLALTNGFITVNADLRARNDPDIFAAGDCAHLAHAPRPKAGVYAVRAAPTLYGNLKSILTDWPLKPFRPQRDYLKLISLGRQAALADKFNIGLQGSWLWRLKDRIDRDFMAQFDDLPEMEPPAPPSDRNVASGVRAALGDGQPICGGCGAKVGPSELTAVLSRLSGLSHPDILTGPGDDAAVVRIGDRRQVISADHLRAFTEDPWMMGRIAALHALGDVWAMGAAPQAALATVILPPMSPTLQQRTLTDILEGAASALGDAGSALAGGHTTQGAELTVGFTVTGMARGEPIRVDGGRPGDRLILTQPIGVGVVLAAEMVLKARGRWVQGCWDEMLHSQADAARILAESAHAMTDVTGFGLAGHLLAMLRPAGLAAKVDLARVPLLDGALELTRMGVRSTLYPQNREQAEGIDLPDDPRTPLLFDPQTAGGLLAAVPDAEAPRVCSRLRAAGYDAEIIGQILPDGRPGHLTFA